MRILFISHEASRTGAPLLLLHFLKWLKSKRADIVFEIVLMRGGELAGEFAACAPVRLAQMPAEQGKSIFKRVANRVQRKNNQDTFRKQFRGEKYDLIYGNTVATAELTLMIADELAVRPKLILHIHELNAIIEQIIPDFSRHAAKFDRIIAASKSVAHNLTERRQVNGNRISIVHEFSLLSESRNRSLENYAADIECVAGKFVVGGSGYVHWRKGTDLFLLTARSVFDLKPEFNGVFVWTGAFPPKEKAVLDEDIRKCGLEGKIIFTGALVSPYAWYERFDVFLLPSREDPFPVVALEAGTLGKPLICFRDAGGTEEMLQDGGGKVVPYLDHHKMAEAILEYAASPALLEKDGRHNKESFGKYSIDQIAPELVKLISEYGA